MRCSFLEGKRILSCRSLGTVYIPGIFELGEYCKNDRHKKCLLYHAPAPSGSRGGPFYQGPRSLIAASPKEKVKSMK